MSDWLTAPLSDVAEIERNGIAPENISADTSYIGLEHLDEQGVIATPKSAAEADIKSTKFTFDKQHVLYGKLRPYLRKIALPSFAGVCSTDILPIKPNPGVLDRGYLYRYLRQREMVDLATTRSSGANLPRISPKVLAEFPVRYPSIEEQRRIAAILDKADAIRQKRQHALTLADNFLRATFLDMFGDPVLNPKGWKLEECSSLCSRVTVGLVVKPASYYCEQGIPALRSLNVREDRINENDMKFFSEEDTVNKLFKSRVWEDDVVIVRSGQPGTAAVIPEHLDGVNAIDILIATPDQSKILSRYFCAFLNSPAGRRLVLSEKRGQIQQHLNVGSLNKALVPIPPIEVQAEYLQRVEAVERMKAKLSSQLEASQNLFSSLSQRAFRGEL